MGKREIIFATANEDKTLAVWLKPQIFQMDESDDVVNLLFLDEPASGLDPGTERNLMYSLREMANAGKTVILVTHSTLQLKLCDKIVFMGKGGNLCYFGSHDEALEFFRVNDIIDVYNMISDYAPEWRAYYDNTTVKTGPSKRIPGTVSSTTGRPSFSSVIMHANALLFVNR